MNYFLLVGLVGALSVSTVDAKRYERMEKEERHQEDSSGFSHVQSSFSSQVIINGAYNDISGHLIPEEERAAIKKKMLDAQEIVYGEITHPAVTMLLKELNLTNEDVVYDLGSGVGKFCMQVAIDSPAKKVVGVELCPTRHENAVKAKTMVQDDVRIHIEERLFYKEEDFLKTDISDATVVFLCSTCYSSDLMLALTKKLTKGKNRLRVASLSLLPSYKNQNKEFVLIKTLNNLPMTWDKATTVYLYELQPVGKKSRNSSSKKLHGKNNSSDLK